MDTQQYVAAGGAPAVEPLNSSRDEFSCRYAGYDAIEPCELAELSDAELVTEVKRLAAAERARTAALVASLVEFDRRKLYLAEGCASLFTYCTRVLRLADGAAYNRIEAARVAARFPVVLDRLTAGEINLTTIRRLSPHMTADNHLQLLDAARDKSTREVEQMLANRGFGTASPDVRLLVVRMDGDSVRIELTLSRETFGKFHQLQDALRHAVPDGNPGEIVDRAFTALLRDVERRRFAQVSRPRRTAGASVARQIPAAVRRQVWRRDGGQCAFVGREGRCGERGFLEFHHVQPYAAGGEATVENIALRCRAHNAHEARVAFPPDP